MKMFLVFVAASAAYFFAAFLKGIIRGATWATSMDLNPATAVFPKLCPVCLSTNVDVELEQKSDDWGQKYYPFVSTWKNWKRAVPHCSTCAGKLTRSEVIGWVAGAACVVAVFFVVGPLSNPYANFLYVAFGYPAYTVVTILQKGVMFGKASATVMTIDVRRWEYAQSLAALNGLVWKSSATPPADGKAL